MECSPRRRPGGLAPWVMALSLLAGCGLGDDGESSATESLAPESPVAAPNPQLQEASPLAGEPVSLHAISTPTARFDAEGRLWVVFEKEGHVYLTTSQDRGQSFAAAVQVTPAVEEIETNGENRPKVALGQEGEVYVSWTRKLEGRFTGEIRFTRSLDGGRTFEPPRTINDDGLAIGHRFESLAVDDAGDVFLAWVDKRDLEAAKREEGKGPGKDFRGASIYYTVSTDRGATFAANRRVANYACECCRIGVALAPEGGVALFWRHVFEPDIRDHAFAVVGREGVIHPMARATRDGWHLDGCPHHGGALATAAEGGYHMAWFTAAGDQPAVYYGRFDPQSGETLHRTLLGKSAVAHPDVATGSGGRVLVVWKELANGETTVVARESQDGGATWSESKPVATTHAASDHPFLLAQEGDIVLSWHTAREGLRILPMS